MVSLKQLLRSRSLRLIVGLAVAVAIPVGALVIVQYRSIRDLERTSSVVLETLSRQVADALSQGLKSQFEKPAYEIERIDHLAIEQLNLDTVSARLRERAPAVPIVSAFYLWSQRGYGQHGVLEMATPATERGAVFGPAGPEDARLLELAQDLAAYRLPWGMAVETVDGRPQALVIHLLFDSSARERLTSFIAFRVDLDRLRREQLPAMLRPLMISANQQTELATLVAEVVDHDGQQVYRSDPVRPVSALEERPLPLVFFAPDIMPARDPCPDCQPEWILRVGYREGSATAIARASTTGYRTLLAVLAFVLALGVVLAGRTALKEMQLAEAKSHFVASVSHDLKTPLALIQLFAETLELGRVKNAGRAREYYAIINSEARKLGALINNVLDFSRIESGLRMYRLQPIDLGPVVRHVVEGFRAQSAQEGFDLRVDIEEGLPAVLADEEAVGLAVGNLVSNAMKYSGRSRSVAVEVRAGPRGALVRVRDEGIGIPRRYHRRIFRKFYRVEGEAADAPRGCGLGLAIVDQVMRAHRGRVLIESEPGKGSTFTLVFPATAEKQRDEADSRDRRRAPDAAGVA